MGIGHDHEVATGVGEEVEDHKGVLTAMDDEVIGRIGQFCGSQKHSRDQTYHDRNISYA